MSPSYQIVAIRNSRLFVPPDFLPVGTQIVLTKGLHHNLLLCRREIWEPMEKEILSLPQDDKIYNILTRLVVGNATGEIIDSDGTVLVPADLLEYAQLGTSVYWEQTDVCVRIWNPATFTECRDLDHPEPQSGVDAAIDLNSRKPG